MRNRKITKQAAARAQLLAGIISESDYHEIFGLGSRTTADHTDFGDCVVSVNGNKLSVRQVSDEDFFASLSHKHANFEIDLDDHQVAELLSHLGDDYKRYERKMHLKHGVPFTHKAYAKVRLSGNKLLIDDGFTPCVGFNCSVTLTPQQAREIAS